MCITTHLHNSTDQKSLTIQRHRVCEVPHEHLAQHGLLVFRPGQLQQLPIEDIS